MAWWISRSSAYAGPGFDWVDPESVIEKRGLYGSGLSLSRPLTERHIPKIGRYRKPFGTAPVADVFFVSSSVVVTKRFKNLVEKFEPGVHLFSPIALQYHDSTSICGEYYFFNCNVDIDCIITDNNPAWFKNAAGRYVSRISIIEESTPIDIVIAKNEVSGHHLWTGGPLGWNQLFVSDVFCDALRKNDIRQLDFRRHCQEVDRSWVAEENMGPLLEKWQRYVANDRNVEMGYL